MHPVAGTANPVKLSRVCPAVNVAGASPAQPAPETPTVWPTSTCILTRESEKLALVCPTPVGLVNVSVTVDCCPCATIAGANDLEMPTRPTPSVAVLDGFPAAGVSVAVAPVVVFA